MPDTIEVVLTPNEVDGLLRALDACGTNSRDMKVQLKFFQDPQFVTAALSAQRKLQRQAAARQKSTLDHDQPHIESRRFADDHAVMEKRVPELLRELKQARIDRDDAIRRLDEGIAALEKHDYAGAILVLRGY